MEQHAKPHLESGVLPTPGDVRDASNSFVGNARMIRAGRGDALDEVVKTIPELQDSLIPETHKAALTDAGTIRS